MLDLRQFLIFTFRILAANPCRQSCLLYTSTLQGFLQEVAEFDFDRGDPFLLHKKLTELGFDFDVPRLVMLVDLYHFGEVTDRIKKQASGSLAEEAEMRIPVSYTHLHFHEDRRNIVEVEHEGIRQHHAAPKSVGYAGIYGEDVGHAVGVELSLIHITVS